MEIEWEVEDGYIGGSRPQSLTLISDDFENCKTVEDAMEVVNEAVQEDFRQTVTYKITNYDEIKKKLEYLITNR